MERRARHRSVVTGTHGCGPTCQRHRERDDVNGFRAVCLPQSRHANAFHWHRRMPSVDIGGEGLIARSMRGSRTSSDHRDNVVANTEPVVWVSQHNADNRRYVNLSSRDGHIRCKLSRWRPHLFFPWSIDGIQWNYTCGIDNEVGANVVSSSQSSDEGCSR